MCVPVRSYSRSVLRLRSRFGGCFAGAGAEYCSAYDKQDTGNFHFSILVLLSEAMMRRSFLAPARKVGRAGLGRVMVINPGADENSCR